MNTSKGTLMKIAIIDAHDHNYDEIADISMPNREKYAKKHGYTFHVYKFNKLVPEQRSPHWGRVLAIEQFLPSYDWIFYCDTDAIILNDTMKIEDQIDDKYDIIAGPMPHEGHLSTAGLIIKNSPWVMNFLKVWYSQTHFIDHPYFATAESDHGATSTDGGGMFFEQSAFEFLYDTNAEIRGKIKRIPRKFFNAIASSAYMYNRGDFLIHFPGIPKQDKLNLMKTWIRKTIKC